MSKSIEVYDEKVEHQPLPTDSAKRKEYPVYSGFLKYFPCAVAEVSHLSYLGNLKHHSDKPLHWDQDKSTDERDCLARHMLDMECSPDKDTEVLEAASVAWRSMANLERILTGKCNYSQFNHCNESNEEHN